MEKRYNMRSPAVKRLMREAIELKDPTPMFHAQPLEDNLFEWHFTIQGPPGTEFEGGYYHGRILLPTEYPMKPPSIIMLTPNGRFELYQKICLSASAYHPELWQPSWSIRTVLLAIIGFMPTEGVGAIGSMDCSPEERKRLARRSMDWMCSECNVPNRDILPQGEAQEATMSEAANIVTQMAFKSVDEVKKQKTELAKSHAVETTTPEDSPETPPDIVEEIAASPPPSHSQETETQVVEEGLRQRHHYPTSERVVPVQETQLSKDGWGSLLLVGLLLLAIAILLARRMFFM